MAEYIERETVFRGLAEICEKYRMCFGKQHGGFAEALHNLPDEMPKSDVVEVVRCKECSFWDVVKTRKNVGVCTPPINDGRGGYCTRHGATYENDYCSFGRILKCPACGEKYNLYSMKDRSSCPNCGAKIDKEEKL